MTDPDAAKPSVRSRRGFGGSTFDQELLCCPNAELATDDDARIREIGRELAYAFEAFGSIDNGVSFFGSARVSPGSPEYNLARRIAATLGEQGFSIITGGGPGLMEAANRGAFDVGARSIGLTIELPAAQSTNPYVQEAIPFRHFFARKLMFVRYASAFVVLPGGFGTIDELFEALTLVQTGTIEHFPIVLVSTDYWRGLVQWIDDRLRGGDKVSDRDVALLSILDDPDQIAGVIATAQAPQIQPGGGSGGT